MPRQQVGHAPHDLLVRLLLNVMLLRVPLSDARVRRRKLDGWDGRPDSAEPSVILHCLAADQMKRDAIEYYRRPTVAHG